MKTGSLSRIVFLRLAALALVSVFGCAMAAAQTTTQIIAISPGEQIFAVDSAYYIRVDFFGESSPYVLHVETSR